MAFRLAPLVVLAVACDKDGSHPTDTEDTDVASDTDTDTDTDVPADTDTDTTVPGDLTDVSSRLHETYPTIVIVSWTQASDASVHVEYSFDAGVWLSSPVRELPAGPHEELLLGIPYGMTATWKIVAVEADTTVTTPEATIDTAPVPPTLPTAVIGASDPAGWDATTPYFFVGLVEDGGDFGGRWWAILMDRQGRAVWGTRSSLSMIHMHPRITWNQDALLLDQNNYWGDFGSGGVDSSVSKMQIDGTVLETWMTPGLHHDYTDMPDGSLAYGAIELGYGDEHLVVLHPDGTSEVLFSCDDFLKDIGEVNTNDCGSNTLSYNETTNQFLFSLFIVETIVEIDATTGVYDKWFGHVLGSWDFDPPQSIFWYQHGGYVTPEGTLITSTHTEDRPPGGENVAREYTFDEAATTLHNTATYGLGDGVYGDQMGEAHKLVNGNVLLNYGTLARLREYQPDGTVVWDIWWPGSSDVGRSAPVHDLYALAPPRP
jgi:hypothetical protein